MIPPPRSMHPRPFSTSFSLWWDSGCSNGPCVGSRMYFVWLSLSFEGLQCQFRLSFLKLILVIAAGCWQCSPMALSSMLDFEWRRNSLRSPFSGESYFVLKILATNILQLFWPITDPPPSSSLAFVDFLTGIICTPIVILTYYFSKY